MDIIEIETRCGLIIQEVVATAFRQIGIPFAEGIQYNPDCETPDFLLPNEKAPNMIIECHQTNVRESLRMKILRLLSAVFEAKVYFGKEIVSVNLLFGNVDQLSPKNLETFSSFYDVSYFPERDSEHGCAIKLLEQKSREYAANEKYNVKTAAEAIVTHYSSEVTSLANYLSKTIGGSGNVPKKFLFPIWESEIERVKKLKESPAVAGVTEYKSSILSSLLLSNKDFEELVASKDPNECSVEVKHQLIRTGLVTVRPTTIKKYKAMGFLTLSDSFTNFVEDPYAMQLRELCRTQLEKEPALGFFFEDIRNEQRRKNIAREFIRLVNLSEQEFINAVQECFTKGSCFGVEHGRCWIADMMPLVVSESQNTFNRMMIASPNYHQTLRNPYANIVIRSPRLGSNKDTLCEYITVAVECFYAIVKERKIDLSALREDELADKLFKFRKDAVIKLHKLNPLHIAVFSIANDLGLQVSYGGVKSFVSDLAHAKYDLFTITDGKKEVLLNALYKSPDYGSDHKADEWSARRRALGYRMQKGQICEVPSRAGYIFVIDGTWTAKSIRKFYHAGWDHVCRLWQLKGILKTIYDIKD